MKIWLEDHVYLKHVDGAVKFTRKKSTEGMRTKTAQ